MTPAHEDIFGWCCNSCDQYCQQDNIPNKCENCGRQEFRAIGKTAEDILKKVKPHATKSRNRRVV